MSVTLPKLHRPPHHSPRSWQVGRTGLALISHEPRRWTVTVVSTACQDEMNWIHRHRLWHGPDGDAHWPTRREALRCLTALLAADPLADRPVAPRPQRTAPGVFVSPQGHWQAVRQPDRGYRATPLTEAADAHGGCDLVYDVSLSALHTILSQLDDLAMDLCMICERHHDPEEGC